MNDILSRLGIVTTVTVAALAMTSCDAIMEPSMSMGINVGSGGVIPFTDVGAIFTPSPPPRPVVAGPSYWGVNFVPPHDPGWNAPGWNTPSRPGGGSSIVPSRPVRPSGEPGPVILPSHTPVDNPSGSPARPGGRVPAGNSGQIQEAGPGLGNSPGMIINGQNRPIPSGGGGRF